MRVARRDDRAEVFAFRRDDPKSAGSRNVQIAFLIDLDAVESVFAGRAREIEEEFSILQRAIRLALRSA